jgi:hypothetical protein
MDLCNLSREEQFEHEFPFYRVYFTDFKRIVDIACKDPDSAASIEDLAYAFEPLNCFYVELNNSNSQFVRTLS